ncbi:hypothetical protein [Nocardia sp. NBC_00416]|uniref:hypothetical protein n=1 Tax=Nocardia sp. NBC_00416 TaxID=2975991 RepID=UPI002E1D4A61
MSGVRRFWIEFDQGKDQPYLPILSPGVGVTGFDVRDCLSMVTDLVGDEPLPPVRRITVDISLAEPLPLNPRHLGVPVWRGVWYPPVNLRTGPIRTIDRTGAPCDSTTPVTASRHRTRTDETLRTTWWDEIPHIDALWWPLVGMHCGGRMRYHAPDLRDTCATDPTYGILLREALDYMIARRPTPEEWFDPTGIRFADERELGEYLRAFLDYLVGTRPEPIYLPPVSGFHTTGNHDFPTTSETSWRPSTPEHG